MIWGVATIDIKNSDGESLKMHIDYLNLTILIMLKLQKVLNKFITIFLVNYMILQEKYAH